MKAKQKTTPTQDKRREDLDFLAADITKTFGQSTAVRGGLQKTLMSIPTGSLALDYELGTGGWPLGYLVGVFGPRDIGKSSMVGLNAARNAQQLDMNVAWIAYEPFDEKWARKNGVKTDDMLVAYPTTGEEAFSMLHKIVKSRAVDLVIFDSIGAVISEKEMGDDGKPRVGGQAGLITWAVKTAAPLAWKNDVCVILLNQVRDDMQSRIPGLVAQPGGHALEHHESIIVQLKRGKNRFSVKQNGTDVQIGQEIVAHIVRNKMTEGTGHKALFDYYYAETDDYPFGIDAFTDIIQTGKRTGVIPVRGSMYDLPDGTTVKGWDKVVAHLEARPDTVEMIRVQVLQVMLDRNTRTVLEVVPEVEDAAAAS
jgi:recombination protein RecA